MLGRLLALAVVSLGCESKPRTDLASVDADEGVCEETATRCDGIAYLTCRDARWEVAAECPLFCAPGLGCTDCLYGQTSCEGASARHCDTSGNWISETCVENQVCSPQTGRCVDPCDPDLLGKSYIGCEYFPTVIGNNVSHWYSFAVAVANVSDVTATVVVTGGALEGPRTFVVPSKGVHVEKLPWQVDLKLCLAENYSLCNAPPHTSVLAPGGAYHLRSSVPVMVYQFNPLEYFVPGAPENSYTNDASLLFPTNAWQDDYLVAAWHSATTMPTLMAVTALEDQTELTILSTITTIADQGAPLLEVGIPTVMTLNRGDVVEFGKANGWSDLTGSRIRSTKPIQVISGSYGATIPDFYGYADHLEESMMPVATLGFRYAVVAPATTAFPNGKEQHVRIIAVQDDTMLSFDPPLPGVETYIARAGEFVQIERNTAPFVVTGSHKILVAQYMQGRTTVGEGDQQTGDPAMTLTAPVEQFRDEYVFVAPTNYQTNFVDVVAPTGTTVFLDGNTIAPVSGIGTSEFIVLRASLGPGPAGDGQHVMTADAPFSVSVYGYGVDTSYWYPGGLNLKTIDPE